MNFGVLAQLLTRLCVRVEGREAVDDDRNGQGHEDEAAQSAHAAYHVAERRHWYDVSVAECGHCYDGPPQADQYTIEFVVFHL